MYIFIYGQDDFRAKEKILELQKKFTKDVDKTGSSYERINGETLDNEKLKSIFFSGSLFSKKRMFLIENIFKNKDKVFIKEAVKFLNEQKESENIIIFYEEFLTIKNKKNKIEIILIEQNEEKALLVEQKKLYDFLKKQPYVQYYPLLTNKELILWIKKRANDNEIKIEDKVINILIFSLNNNLWLINGELEKIIHYKKALEQNIITEKDIKDNIKIISEQSIFSLTDAISNGDKKNFLKFLGDLLNQGQNEYYLLTMIIRQFKILIQIRSGLDNGLSPQKIGTALKLHPFVLQKSVIQVRHYKLQDLKNIFNFLVKADYEFKNGGLNIETMLDLLVAKK